MALSRNPLPATICSPSSNGICRGPREREAMASTRAMPPSLLVVAAFSRHAAALSWAEEQFAADYGEVALRHQYAFDHTEYYQKEMGAGLIKWLLVFERLVGADC